TRFPAASSFSVIRWPQVEQVTLIGIDGAPSVRGDGFQLHQSTVESVLSSIVVLWCGSDGSTLGGNLREADLASVGDQCQSNNSFMLGARSNSERCPSRTDAPLSGPRRGLFVRGATMPCGDAAAAQVPLGTATDRHGLAPNPWFSGRPDSKGFAIG